MIASSSRPVPVLRNSIFKNKQSKTTERPAKLNKPWKKPRDPLRPILDRSITLTIDPVSGTLSDLEKSTKRIYSSSQAMDRTIQKVIKLNNSPPQPSTSKIALDHRSPVEPSFHSVEQAFQWSQIYIRYLKSSPNPQVFAKRIQELIHKRLPKKVIEPIIRYHCSTESEQEGLVSIDSYNQLIAYYYRTERYHYARRLIKEMEEKGILKNQETQELIACSYQALNKFKGVQLSLDLIKEQGHQLSNQTLTRLFSIRPRRASRVEHFDSMDDPIGREQGGSFGMTTRNERWMSIDNFLQHHQWDSENFRKDGRALVTLTKRLMELDKWKEAHKLVEMILSSDRARSHAEGASSRLDISSYWATSLLESLIFGLYNLKRSMTKKNPTPAQQQEERLPVDCIFKFVETFIDQHPQHGIKTNTKMFLNCLRIQTCLRPSEIQTICQTWTTRYGLDPQSIGSRLGIRLLHVISAWFIKSIRITHSLILSQNSSSPNDDQILKNLKELITEYLVIDRHLLGCLSSRTTGDDTSSNLLWIEKALGNGPIDAKLVPSQYRFVSIQDIDSIKISLKKLFKIRTKILKLMSLNLSSDHQLISTNKLLEEACKEEEEDAPKKDEIHTDLLNVYGSILGDDHKDIERFIKIDNQDQGNNSAFNLKFNSLLDRFNQQQQQSQSNNNEDLNLDVVHKFPTHPDKNHHHALLVWKSENKLSPPIYFKSSSSSS
ncbi:hypothetical protein Pst134EB_020436 [Puccinia striiformis f. sp. tritici]|nr:hypothetical protein Pst134EB_020436 [Puccinia striiformis f. sp. tritici]